MTASSKLQQSNTHDTLRTRRSLRVLIVITLVILTSQGWFGDFVNIFVAPASGVPAPAFSVNGFFQAVQSLGIGLIWHAFEGIVLVALSLLLLGLSFKWSRARSVRICLALAALMIISAALGGFLFVMSGFANGGNSAQMGGSFIGAYAFNFMALYYSK